MAGTNQASNLGGMLSQIGQTLGRERDISSLTRGIQNMSRPSGMFGGPKPGTDEYDQQLANWQNRMGRPQEAAVTASMMGERRVREAAAAKADKQAQTDAFSMEVASLNEDIAMHLANGNTFEAAAAEAQLRNLQAPTATAQKTKTDGLAAAGTAFEGADNQRVGRASQAYAQNQERIAKLKNQKRDVAPDSQEALRIQQGIDALSNANNELLSDPKVSEQVKKQSDTLTGIKANEDAAEVSAIDDRLSRIGFGKEGSEGLASYLEDATPAERERGKAILDAVREMESVQAQFKEANVENNEAYSGRITTLLDGLNLTEIAKDNYKAKIESALKKKDGVDGARLSRVDLKKIHEELTKLSVKEGTAEGAGKAWSMSTIKSLTPALLRQFADDDPNASSWFGGTDIDDIAEDLLEDQSLMDDLSARMFADGITTTEAAKDFLLDYMGDKDEGLFTWLGADRADVDYQQKVDAAKAGELSNLQAGETVIINGVEVKRKN